MNDLMIIVISRLRFGISFSPYSPIIIVSNPGQLCGTKYMKVS